MSAKTRLLARLRAAQCSTHAQHYVGLPPELSNGTDHRVELTGTVFLLIEATMEGAFLYRYDGRGDCVGDTWHESVEDAMAQALFEYSATQIRWEPVPADIVDPVQFGLS